MSDKLGDASVIEQLAQLRTIYVARLPAEFTALDALAAALGNRELSRGNLDELHNRLHKLAGSGGTFGLAKLSSHARVIEQEIKAMLAETFEVLDQEICKKLVSDILSLRAEVDA